MGGLLAGLPIFTGPGEGIPEFALSREWGNLGIGGEETLLGFYQLGGAS